MRQYMIWNFSIRNRGKPGRYSDFINVRKAYGLTLMHPVPGCLQKPLAILHENCEDTRKSQESKNHNKKDRFYRMPKHENQGGM
jgi:hypothetical protein